MLTIVNERKQLKNVFLRLHKAWMYSNFINGLIRLVLCVTFLCFLFLSSRSTLRLCLRRCNVVVLIWRGKRRFM